MLIKLFMLIKYIFIGALIVFFASIIIMAITVIIRMMTFDVLIIFLSFILLSIMVGAVMFRICEKPNEYKFYISSPDNGIFYTNDFTVSNGAITFIDENGNENTIDSKYTLKKMK